MPRSASRVARTKRASWAAMASRPMRVDIIDRRMEADHPDDVRRPRLEARRRRRDMWSSRTSPCRSSRRRPATAASRRESRPAPRARRCRSGRRACGPRRRRSRNRARRRRPASAAPPGSRRAAAWRRPSARCLPRASRRAPSQARSRHGPSATMLCSGRIIAAIASRSMRWSGVSGTTSISAPASCQGTMLL